MTEQKKETQYPRVWLAKDHFDLDGKLYRPKQMHTLYAEEANLVCGDNFHLMITKGEHEALLAQARSEAAAEAESTLLGAWITRLTNQCIKERGFPLSERGEGGQDARIDMVSFLKAERAKLNLHRSAPVQGSAPVGAGEGSA